MSFTASNPRAGPSLPPRRWRAPAARPTTGRAARSEVLPLGEVRDGRRVEQRFRHREQARVARNQDRHRLAMRSVLLIVHAVTAYLSRGQTVKSCLSRTISRGERRQAEGAIVINLFGMRLGVSAPSARDRLP